MHSLGGVEYSGGVVELHSTASESSSGSEAQSDGIGNTRGPKTWNERWRCSSLGESYYTQAKVRSK